MLGTFPSVRYQWRASEASFLPLWVLRGPREKTGNYTLNKHVDFDYPLMETRGQCLAVWERAERIKDSVSAGDIFELDLVKEK